jgi:hypothetical protein
MEQEIYIKLKTVANHEFVYYLVKGINEKSRLVLLGDEDSDQDNFTISLSSYTRKIKYRKEVTPKESSDPYNQFFPKSLCVFWDTRENKMDIRIAYGSGYRKWTTFTIAGEPGELSQFFKQKSRKEQHMKIMDSPSHAKDLFIHKFFKIFEEEEKKIKIKELTEFFPI